MAGYGGKIRSVVDGGFKDGHSGCRSHIYTEISLAIVRVKQSYSVTNFHFVIPFCYQLPLSYV